MLLVLQNRCIHSHIKRFCICFLVAIIIIVVLLAYNRYIEGTIELDPVLYSEENLNAIALKWHELTHIDSDKLVYHDDIDTLWYYTKTDDSKTKDLIMVRMIGSEEKTANDKTVYTHGAYQRVDLLSALCTPASFGNCTSKFFVQGDSIEISGILYDTDGSSEPFDKVFRYLLYIE